MSAVDRQLTVGKVTLNYRLDGAGGEPLLCIHGVGSSLQAWDGVVQRLKEHFTVLTYDLRGHGASTRLKGRYDIDEIVDETLALADAIGFSTFNLAGFSLGGLIAQRLTLKHPERVRRLVLLSTVAGRNTEEQARVKTRLEALQSGEPGAHYDASLSRWLTEGFQAKNPALVTQLRQRNSQNDPQCYAAAYRILAESDYGDMLDQIKCATLIATGEDDAGSNPRMASFMHQRIGGSHLNILPGLRHSILTEAPVQVASIMKAFLLQTTLQGQETK